MLQFKVTGMSCGGCEKAVEAAVAEVAGVDRVINVSRTDEQVSVEGNPDPTAVVEVIRGKGFQAQVV